MHEFLEVIDARNSPLRLVTGGFHECVIGTQRVAGAGRAAAKVGYASEGY